MRQSLQVAHWSSVSNRGSQRAHISSFYDRRIYNSMDVIDDSWGQNNRLKTDLQR